MLREKRAGKNVYYLLDGKNVLKEWGTQVVTVTNTAGTPAVPIALRPRDLDRPATATKGGVTVSITQEIIDYTHGLGLLSHRTTISRFYRWDGIGSLRNLEDSSRNVVTSSVFDAYGLQQNAVTLASAYGFIGEEGVRGEKGQAPGTVVPWNMRARMYDPLTGRFTSRDPIWDNNQYAYGNGNPWSFTDAEGMQASKLASALTADERGVLIWNGIDPDYHTSGVEQLAADLIAARSDPRAKRHFAADLRRVREERLGMVERLAGFGGGRSTEPGVRDVWVFRNGAPPLRRGIASSARIGQEIHVIDWGVYRRLLDQGLVELPSSIYGSIHAHESIAQIPHSKAAHPNRSSDHEAIRDTQSRRASSPVPMDPHGLVVSGGIDESQIPVILQAQPAWCGRASEAMLIWFWRPDLRSKISHHSKAWEKGHPLEQNQIPRLTGQPYVGAFLKKLDKVALSVAAGYPAIVYTNVWADVDPPGNHIILLIGYDVHTHQFYANDTFVTEHRVVKQRGADGKLHDVIVPRLRHGRVVKLHGKRVKLPDKVVMVPKTVPVMPHLVTGAGPSVLSV